MKTFDNLLSHSPISEFIHLVPHHGVEGQLALRLTTTLGLNSQAAAKLIDVGAASAGR